MSFAPETTPTAEIVADPKALLRVSAGLASPLWPLFAGVAVSGAAWWWMTRWAQPANLEAMFGAAEKAQEEAVALAEPLVEALAETEHAFEAAAETLAEPVIEAGPEPVLEALVEEPAALEPVGGEAVPISPVLEALGPEAPEAFAAVEAPKPKKKAAPPIAD